MSQSQAPFHGRTSSIAACSTAHQMGTVLLLGKLASAAPWEALGGPGSPGSPHMESGKRFLAPRKLSEDVQKHVQLSSHLQHSATE